MILQLGFACLILWLVNFCWLLYTIMKETPNWRDEEVDSNDIVTNFLKNSSVEKIKFFGSVGKLNPWIGISGLFFIAIGLMI